MAAFSLPAVALVPFSLVADSHARFLADATDALILALGQAGYPAPLRPDGTVWVGSEVDPETATEINEYMGEMYPGVALIWVIGGGKTIIHVVPAV